MANNNNNKTLNVPNLRFAEFGGEWKKVKVSDLLEFYSTNSLSWEMLDYDNGEFLNLHYGLIHKGLPTMVDVESDVLPFVGNGNMPRSYTLCKNGDVAFADASEDTNDVSKAIEFMNCSNKDIVCGLHTIHGRDKTNSTIVGYKGYAFVSSSFHKQIRRIAQGTKIYSINTRNFDESFIGIPSKQEQAKIAKLLFAIDKRIATQNKIIEDLKKLKSAIIDKLYTDVNGVFYSYGDLMTIVTEKNKANEYSNILSASQELGMIERNELNIDIKYEESAIIGYKIVRKGDYVVHLRSFQGGMAFSQKTGVCSPAYTILRPNDKTIYGYLAPYFTSLPFINSLRLVTYGIRDGRSINVDEWLDMKICIPSLESQLHTLSIISSLSNKLLNESSILNRLLEQRKYLLQQMFI